MTHSQKYMRVHSVINLGLECNHNTIIICAKPMMACDLGGAISQQFSEEANAVMCAEEKLVVAPSSLIQLRFVKGKPAATRVDHLVMLLGVKRT